MLHLKRDSWPYRVAARHAHARNPLLPQGHSPGIWNIFECRRPYIRREHLVRREMVVINRGENVTLEDKLAENDTQVVRACPRHGNFESSCNRGEANSSFVAGRSVDVGQDLLLKAEKETIVVR